jgi:hypothetical protein
LIYDIAQKKGGEKEKLLRTGKSDPVDPAESAANNRMLPEMLQQPSSPKRSQWRQIRKTEEVRRVISHYSVHLF